MATRIGITGVSGFLGRPVAQKLLEKGYSVRALINQNAVDDIPGLDIVYGSVTSPETLKPFVEEVDVLIHCAALVAAVSNKDFYEVNVRGTRNLMKALDPRRKTRCLFISSLAARHAKISPYAESKRLGEKVIEGFKQRDYDILRPPAIYGPGEENMLPLYRYIHKGIAFHVGSRESRFSMIYIDDMVNAIVQWVESNNTTQTIYEIADYKIDGYSWNDFSSCAIKVLDAKDVRTIRIPEIPALFIGLTVGAVNKLLRRKSFVNENKVRELCYKDWVTHERNFEDAFHWKPEVSLLDGMQRTVAWYKEHQKLEKPAPEQENV